MAYLYLFSIVVSIALTLMVLEKFELKGHVRLTLFNIFLPFGGLLYALYVVHVVIPNLVEKQTGFRPASPLQPHIDAAFAKIKPIVKSAFEKIKVLILGDKNDHRID